MAPQDLVVPTPGFPTPDSQCTSASHSHTYGGVVMGSTRLAKKFFGAQLLLVIGPLFAEMWLLK